MNYLYFDTETSGLPKTSYEYDKTDIIEMAYIIADDEGDILTAGDNFFLNQRSDIEPAAFQVHGLTEAKLYSLTSFGFEDYIPNIIDLINSVGCIVAHNASFDVERMMSYNNTKLNNLIKSKKIICTMKDFPKQTLKTVYDNKRKAIVQSYSKLSELYWRYILLNCDSKNIKSEYLKIFKSAKDLDSFHSASFDTFILYKLHQYLRTRINAG